MAVSMRATVKVDPKFVRILERAQQPALQRVFRGALTEMALRVQRNAVEKQIIPGGKFGGIAAPPHPTRVTSRTGELVRSIGVDKSGLWQEISVGSELVYAPVHEFGSRTHPERPYLSPALEAERPRFDSVLKRHIERFIFRGS